MRSKRGRLTVRQQALHGSELAKGGGRLSRLADPEEEEGQELKDVVQDRVDAVLFVFDGRFARDGVGVNVVRVVSVFRFSGRGRFRSRADLVQAGDCERGYEARR